jgi:hypothetical protein
MLKDKTIRKPKAGTREAQLGAMREQKLDEGDGLDIPTFLQRKPGDKFTTVIPAKAATSSEPKRDFRIPKGMSTEEGNKMLADEAEKKRARSIERVNKVRATKGKPPIEASKESAADDTAGDASGEHPQAPGDIPSGQQETATMSTATKRKTTIAKTAKTAKTATSKGERRKRGAAKRSTARSAPKRSGVTNAMVGDFTCTKTGVTMDQMVSKFGITAHALGNKIFYARHNEGYKIELKDGRYFGIAPKKKG